MGENKQRKGPGNRSHQAIWRFIGNRSADISMSTKVNFWSLSDLPVAVKQPS